jgi:hypothetical protein
VCLEVRVRTLASNDVPCAQDQLLATGTFVVSSHNGDAPVDAVSEYVDAFAVDVRDELWAVIVVLGELMTNLFRHADPPFAARLTMAGGRLRLAGSPAGAR